MIPVSRTLEASCAELELYFARSCDIDQGTIESVRADVESRVSGNLVGPKTNGAIVIGWTLKPAMTTS